MSKSKRTVAQEAYIRGYDAYYAGQPRTACPHPLRMSFREHWEKGWDEGLFAKAASAGFSADADAACPYAHPETAAHWVRGWRVRHELAVICGKENRQSQVGCAVERRPARRQHPGYSHPATNSDRSVWPRCVSRAPFARRSLNLSKETAQGSLSKGQRAKGRAACSTPTSNAGWKT